MFYFRSDIMAQYELEKKKPLNIWLEFSPGWPSLLICGHLTTKIEVTWPPRHILLMNLGILEILSWGTNFFLRSSCISFCSDQVAYHVSYFVCNYWMIGLFMSLLLTLLKSLVKNCMTAWLSGILIRRYLQLLLTTALQMMQ